MEIGATTATTGERFIRRLKVSILESRSMRLGEAWNLDLCSPFWRLYDQNRSGAWLRHGGKHLLMAKGELWMIPAWVRFQTGISREVEQNYIHFEVRGLPWGLLKRSFSRPVQLPVHPALTAVCEQWRHELHSGDEFSHLCWATVLANAAVASVLPTEVASRGSRFRGAEEIARIQPAMDCLMERTRIPASNQELAALCGMGEDHFIRRFRDGVGMTPARFGREHRIALAAEWLTSSERTLEEIAEAGGFTDRFHFSRVFKAHLGQSPGAYRRMHRREFVALGESSLDGKGRGAQPQRPNSNKNLS